MNYLFDNDLNFATAVSLAADSTSDVLNLGPNIGTVERVDLKIDILTHDHTGAGTLTINLQDSADGSTSWTTRATSGALTFNTLADGDVVNIPMPVENEAYLKVVFDVSTALTGTVAATVAPFARRPA